MDKTGEIRIAMNALSDRICYRLGRGHEAEIRRWLMAAGLRFWSADGLYSDAYPQLFNALDDEGRLGKERFKAFDMARYSKSLFGMFGGEETSVILQGENHMVGILMDRFGKDIPLVPIDDEHFEAKVNVAVSPQFFGWIMALGKGITITDPEPVVRKMREEVRRLSEQYGEK